MSKELWVWIEHDRSKPRKTSLEVLGKARDLGCVSVAVILGAATADVASYVSRFADRVIVAESRALAHYTADAYASALARLIEDQRPDGLLMGGSVAGRELAPRVAACLHAAYIADCIDIVLDINGPTETPKPSLIGRRALHGGKVYAWVRPTGGCFPVMTIRPNAFDLPEQGIPAPIEAVAIDVLATKVKVLEARLHESKRPELSEADVVVAGGRGMGAAKNFRFVEELADALNAALGASRAVVDAGWRSHHEQIGKSGKTISPRLYIALGISGAIHHVMGMDTAGVIVAINRESAAPIFQVADFGLVGDVLEIAPALRERLRSKAS